MTDMNVQKLDLGVSDDSVNVDLNEMGIKKEICKLYVFLIFPSHCVSLCTVTHSTKYQHCLVLY